MSATELLELYRRVLDCAPESVYRHEVHGDLNQVDALYSPRDVARWHARWMLDHMQVMLTHMHKTAWPADPPFNRWLGFVQCVLWMTGEYTLNQLRAHIREAARGDGKLEP